MAAIAQYGVMTSMFATGGVSGLTPLLALTGGMALIDATLVTYSWWPVALSGSVAAASRYQLPWLIAAGVAFILTSAAVDIRILRHSEALIRRRDIRASVDQ